MAGLLIQMLRSLSPRLTKLVVLGFIYAGCSGDRLLLTLPPWGHLSLLLRDRAAVHWDALTCCPSCQLEYSSPVSSVWDLCCPVCPWDGLGSLWGHSWLLLSRSWCWSHWYCSKAWCHFQITLSGQELTQQGLASPCFRITGFRNQQRSRELRMHK